jgi:hypothetical protein
MDLLLEENPESENDGVYQFSCEENTELFFINVPESVQCAMSSDGEHGMLEVSSGLKFAFFSKTHNYDFSVDFFSDVSCTKPFDTPAMCYVQNNNDDYQGF